MEYFSFLCAVLLLYLAFNLTKKYIERAKYNGIPGPTPLPVIGVTHKLKDPTKLHLLLQKWAQDFGGVVYMPVLSGHDVLVSNYDGIHEVTINKGLQCGGRPSALRISTLMKNTGIAFSKNPDAKWKSLRKSSHKLLKQFGDGMQHLEDVILDVSDEMFNVFCKNQQKAYDPYDCIMDIALETTSLLIVGQKPDSGDRLMNLMRRFERDFARCVGPLAHPKLMLLDLLPWIRHFNYKPWTQDMSKLLEVGNEVWAETKRIVLTNPDLKSLVKMLLNNMDTMGYDEIDVHSSTLDLLLAGLVTTGHTFYAAVNILAHKQDIQNKIREEIDLVCPTTNAVNIKDKPNMPYTRAFLYELLRYTSVAPLSLPHRATVDTTIQGYNIPQNTTIHLNLYHLHHDPYFWKDPDVFRPERFLDDAGDVVPADHPHRKHLMPFGSGTRVCLGESFAMARIFLWVASFVKQMKVIPAEGNDPSTMSPSKSKYDIALRPAAYEVQLQILE